MSHYLYVVLYEYSNAKSFVMCNCITMIGYYHNYWCPMFLCKTKITASVWTKVKQILQIHSFLHSFHPSDAHSTNAFQSLIYWRNRWRCWGHICGAMSSYLTKLSLQWEKETLKAVSLGCSGAWEGRTALRTQVCWFQWMRRSRPGNSQRQREQPEAEGAATWNGKKDAGSEGDECGWVAMSSWERGNGGVGEEGGYWGLS